MARNRPTPLKVLTLAEKFSKTNKVSPTSLIKAIYSLTTNLEGGKLRDKVNTTFQKYKRSGRINRYATRPDGRRFVIKENSEYKIISDIYEFLDEKKRNGSSSKKKISKKRTMKSKKNIETIVDKDELIKNDPNSLKDEYAREMHEALKEIYWEQFGQDYDGLDTKQRMKLRVMDEMYVKSFAKQLADSNRGHLLLNKILKIDGSFQKPVKAQEQILEIAGRNEKILKGYVLGRREKDNLGVKHHDVDYSDGEDDDDIDAHTRY